jgi:hypothetical protein
VEKHVSLDVTDVAKKWLAVKGFDKLYGARPMARLIQQKIRHKLADELLFGKLEHGGKVLVDIKDDDLVLNCQSLVTDAESGDEDDGNQESTADQKAKSTGTSADVIVPRIQPPLQNADSPAKNADL